MYADSELSEGGMMVILGTSAHQKRGCLSIQYACIKNLLISLSRLDVELQWKATSQLIRPNTIAPAKAQNPRCTSLMWKQRKAMAAVNPSILVIC